MQLSGKIAIVTGGAIRVGRAIALGLAEQGCGVLVHYHGSDRAAQDTAARIEALGVPVAIHADDLTDPAAPARLVQRCVDALGRVDVLVNSAALYLPGGLLDTDLDGWESQLALNLRAPFFLSQAFVRALPADRPGCIVNVCDARLHRAGADHLAYRLTKAALHDLTRNLAVELAPRVRVNEVAPGAILPPPAGDPVAYEAMRAEIPLDRTGDTDEVVAAVRYLLASDFVTGASIPVDGGQYL